MDNVGEGELGERIWGLERGGGLGELEGCMTGWAAVVETMVSCTHGATVGMILGCVHTASCGALSTPHLRDIIHRAIGGCITGHDTESKYTHPEVMWLSSLYLNN